MFEAASVPAQSAAAPSPVSAIDPARLPPVATREVSFETDIRPLFERSCLRCHGPERPKSGFRLDDRELALKGGSLGVSLLPGNSAASPLVHYVARLVEDLEMPPVRQGDPLTAEEIGLLRAWIDQGARWSATPAEPGFRFSITPAIQFYTVSGNAARFREHQWTREGWGGGATEFSMSYDADPRTHVDITGRALAGPDDYRFDTRIRRDEIGWARVAYREFSRYQDDTGGYYAPFGLEAPRWGDDFVLRHQHVTTEFGLERPEWPRIRLAYDLHRRDGTEATLHWGPVIQGNDYRLISPGRKRVDETTHLVTLDLSYDWSGLLVSDQAQFEWHDQNNRRTQSELGSLSTVTDRQDYWRGANVLRLERNLRDWLYVSGGYLYSQLEDLGGFSVEQSTPGDPTLPPTLALGTDDLSLRRRSHVVNGNAMLGPWEQLHFYAGLQAEWTRQEGFAAGRVNGLPPLAYDAGLDRAATDESFGLRYAGLPYTVIFAETRFQQINDSQFEEGLADQQQYFFRDTDASADIQDFQAGFTVSPWTKTSLHAKYRHRDRRNHYDHLQEIDLIYSGNGYPAFIRDRDTSGDEVEARLVLQPLRWLKATLRYAISATDFETTTVAWQEIFRDPPVDHPAGSLLAGNYDAHTVSAGFVLTPWTRFHLATTLNWTTSRSVSGVANGQEVVPYEGDLWTLLNTATYLLDEKTDLQASYLFSTADFTQDNEAYGLPLGMAYTRHAATAGLSRRLRRGQSVRIEYGYFNYDEPTLGGAADYTAHGFFASYRLAWP